MGLDQYLNRMPRYKGVTAKQISAMESWFGYQKAKEEGSEYANCSFREWDGHADKNLPKKDVIEHFKQFYTTHYPNWDKEMKYGWDRITDEVGYWRKANAIHQWFVEHIQDGIDDCDYHREVTKEDLEELLDVCHEVLCNPELAEDRLPTQGGFFFGSTVYDEWYIESLKNTIKIIERVLEETDFATDMIYYRSSW